MNLKEALRMRRIPFTQSVSDVNEISICCPFCVKRGQRRPDDRFRLGINLHTGQGHCFNCGWASMSRGVSRVAAALEMGEVSSGVVPGGDQKKKAEPITLPADFSLLADVWEDTFLWFRKAVRYAMNRGITQQQAAEKRIGVSLTGRYAHRLIFPIYRRTMLAGLVTRDYTGSQQPPYLNSAGDKGLYNLRQLKHRCPSVVLVEGVFDCLSVERALSRDVSDAVDVVAVLGRDLTPLQEQQLDGYENVILWPDKDGPGISGMIKIAAMLRLRYRLWWVPPVYDAKDAGDLTPSAVRTAYVSRVPYTTPVGQQWRARMAWKED